MIMPLLGSSTVLKTSLLPECEVRTASYGRRVFSSFYGPSAKCAGHENMERKKRGSITCRTESVRSGTEQTSLIRCLLYGFVDYSWKGTKSFDVLTGDQELQVRTATFRPEIDQSHSTRNQSAI